MIQLKKSWEKGLRNGESFYVLTKEQIEENTHKMVGDLPKCTTFVRVNRQQT